MHKREKSRFSILFKNKTVELRGYSSGGKGLACGLEDTSSTPEHTEKALGIEAGVYL